MSSMTFAPLGHRVIATARTVIVEDVRGGCRELHQFDTVRSTAGGLIVGPSPVGYLHWVMRSWRGRLNRNGLAASRVRNFKNKE